MRRTLAAATLIVGVAGATLVTAGPASAGLARTVSGTVYEDLDGDGTRDPGEPGVAGCTVDLDAGNDGTVNNSTITGVDGSWSMFPVQDTLVAFNVGTCGFDANSSPNEVVLQQGTAPVTGVDFGLFDRGQVFGDTFNDLDGDGVQDAGENFVDGCTVTLDRGADGSVDSSTNTVDGFAFSNLDAGTIRLRATCPGLAAQTTADPADIVVTSGLDQGGILFGFRAQAATTTSTTAAPATTSTAAVSPTSARVLARTGAGDHNGGLGLTGFGLLLAGSGIVVLAARRRTAAS